MHPDDFTFWNCKKPKRIILSQIVFSREWQFFNILNAFYVTRFKTCLLHLFSVKKNIMVNLIHNLFQLFTLISLSLISAHTFFWFIPNHLHFSLSKIIKVL